MRYIFLAVTIVFCSSCEFLESQGKAAKKDSNTVKHYFPDGSIKAEFEALNGKRHGIAKSYHRNGKVRLEMSYVHNVKHGLATSFYETGMKYIETPYDSGEMHGVRKYYRPDGKLMAEMPFFKGKPTVGLKEYLLNGNEKKDYPKLNITVLDEVMLNNRYTLKFSVTNASRKVEYYLGKLDENKCIPEEALLLSSTRPGYAELMYAVPPGRYIMEELNIIAKAQTKLGHSFITERKYNVAVENRGY